MYSTHIFRPLPNHCFIYQGCPIMTSCLIVTRLFTNFCILCKYCLNPNKNCSIRVFNCKSKADNSPHLHVQCSRLELSFLVRKRFCFVFLKARAFQTCVLGVLNTSIMHVYPVIAQTVMKSQIFSSLSLYLYIYIYEYTLLYVIVLLSYEPMVLSVLLTYYLYVSSQIYYSNECVYLFFKAIIYLRTVFS